MVNVSCTVDIFILLNLDSIDVGYYLLRNMQSGDLILEKNY